MKTIILNIDDDPIALFLVNNALRNAGYNGEVVEFVDGKELNEFITKVQNDGNKYLMLLDINMPEVGGWEICDRIAEMPNQSIFDVIIITSSIDRSDRIKAEKYPFIKGFITKPINAADVKAFL